MPYELVMPQYGLTMEEALLSEWLKKPGEAIQKGDLLFVIETDKASAEIESPRSGTLMEILVKAGQTVPVGTVIGRLSLTESDVDEPSPEESSGPKAAPKPITVPVPAVDVSAETDAHKNPPRSARLPLASPRAKRLAKELGIDLAAVSAASGRESLSEEDVRRFAGQKTQAVLAATKVPALDMKEAPSSTRKLIAQRMTASFRDIPHFYLDRTTDATELVKMRQSMFPQIEKQFGVHLTYSDILLKGMASALKECPDLNASWCEDGILRRQFIHLGIAVQAPGRLLVPVVRNADKLSLIELGKERSDLVATALAGKLTPEHLEGASCSLSNLGALHVDHFHAIINPPESAILAVGRIADRPVVVNGAIVARPMFDLSLSVDHRLVDGAVAAGFLDAIVQAIESPYTLLLREH